MDGLRSVTVDIAMNYYKTEEETFEPLVDVARTVNLEVNATWNGDERTRQWPFVVNRGVEAVHYQTVYGLRPDG